MSGTAYNTLPYNIGRSGSIIFVSPSGPLQLNYTDFSSEQTTHNIESRPVNGETIPADIPDMWTGTIEIDRNSPGLESFVAQQEASYYSGAGFALSTLYQYVTEVDGSQTTWEWTNVTITLTKAGSWKQNDRVQQSIKFRASRRKQIS
ncbi:MAG: hypothetical protein ACRYHQ_14645 [Janthinobacterium lividum]